MATILVPVIMVGFALTTIHNFRGVGLPRPPYSRGEFVIDTLVASALSAAAVSLILGV